MKKYISFLVMALVCSLFSFAGPVKADEANSDNELKIGAWLGEQPSASGISTFQSLQKRNLDTVMFYIDWSTSFDAVKSQYIDPIYANGSTAIITWEQWGLTNQDIIDGKKDDYIKTMADSMRDYDEEIWINLMHEANGNWYDWGIGDSESNTDETYIAAYRHVVDLFREENAGKVKFIFCDNCSSCGVGSSFLGHYPGDDYVDYVAMDGYNWGDTQSWGSTWQSFDEIYKNCYDALCTLDKPIIITEMSCAESGGDKAQWITDTYNTIRADYPRIQLVSWFGENKETDWRINSSESALAAYVNAINNSETIVSETPSATEEVIATDTPATTEETEVSETPVSSEMPAVQVSVSTSASSSINQVYQITADNENEIDFSKLKIRYFFSKSGSVDMSFWCDNAAAQLSEAPWYTSLNTITNGKIVKSGYQYYVELSFTDSFILNPGAGTITLQTRFANSDWSSIQDFKEGNLVITYDGEIID